ncbi:MAG TPA: hypothetical protein VGE42_01385, partial [Candidatus Dormibacteraeota bacterium]
VRRSPGRLPAAAASGARGGQAGPAMTRASPAIPDGGAGLWKDAGPGHDPQVGGGRCRRGRGGDAEGELEDAGQGDRYRRRQRSPHHLRAS